MRIKWLAFISAFTVCLTAFASCGGGKSSSGTSGKQNAEGSTPAASETVTASEEDGGKQTAGSGSAAQLTPESAKGGDIAGQWIPEDMGLGLDVFIDFENNGSGSVYADISKLVSAENGKLTSLGAEVSGDDLVIKDGTVSAYYNSNDEDSLIIGLKRTDGAENSSLDGEYTITGGRLADTIYTILEASIGGEPEKLPVTLVINGSETYLRIAGAFTYITEGNRLEVAVMDELSGIADSIAGKEICYTAGNDKLMMTAGGKTVVMQRREK